MKSKVKEIVKYEGGNEYLDKVLEDETVWICQGTIGRIPIIADTKDEAIERYNEKVKEQSKRY